MELRNIEILRVDPDDDAQVQVYADLINTMNKEDFGDLGQYRGIREFQANAKAPNTAYEMYIVKAPYGDDAVGTIEFMMPRIHSVDGARAHIRLVKGMRGYGFGQMMSRFIQKIARERGRTRLYGHCVAPSRRDDRNIRSLLKQGFQEAGMGIRMDRTLPVDCTTLPAQITPPPGYILSLAWGGTPVEWAPAIAEVLDLERLISNPDSLPVTVEHIMEISNADQASGLEALQVIAQEISTGRIVGVTELAHSEGDLFLDQYDINVHPDHRNKGIGRSMEMALLKAVEVAFPTLRRLRAFAPNNDPAVIAMLTSLGFETTNFMRSFTMTLDAIDA